MISVIGGSLYQWDTGRKVKIESSTELTVDEIHFSITGDQTALILKLNDDGITANIPNILLQQAKSIMCYVVMYNTSGEQTIYDCILNVIPRSKPDDYVYTETELEDYKRISEGYEQNVHYEQTAKEVMEILQPLSDNLQYMTYRKRTKLAECSYADGTLIFDEDNTIILDTVISLPSSFKDIIGRYEFDFLTPALRGNSISYFLNNIKIESISNIGGSKYASASLSFNEKFLEQDYMNDMNDLENRPSIEELSNVPCMISFNSSGISIKIYNDVVYGAIGHYNSYAYGLSCTLYELEYYTITELSDALDKLSGEVI